jgi:branched-chain amino acid transport system substrate-binding protein
MTKKITKSGSISRCRLLATVSAGAALAASPFRINCCKSARDAFSL